MLHIVHITPFFAVTGALRPEHVAEVARRGYAALINNRPDGEEAGQLSSQAEQRLSREAGLAYAHVPAVKHDLFSDGVLTAMARALARADGPVLAHCKTGLRSAIVWAGAQARAGADVDRLLVTLAEAGFDLDIVRDELEALAAEPRSASSAHSGALPGVAA